MAKQKEIKFRDRGYVLEGRRGNLTFAIYNGNSKEAIEKQTCPFADNPTRRRVERGGGYGGLLPAT